ncbi:MAG TPA: hydrogenase maturation protease [Thermoplasmata archaeon]|nr:hydrogenase maturation protease [Thermoplasmata archaeon]
MRTIIIGVGNPILGDDGVGVHVVRELKKHVHDPNIAIDEAATGGMNLLDLILGYDKAVIIDALESEKNGEGEVKRMSINDFSTMHSCNPHDVSLVEAVELAKKMGEDKIPGEIIVVGVTVKKKPYEFKEELSEEISKAVPKAVETVFNEIKKDVGGREW